MTDAYCTWVYEQGRGSGQAAGEEVQYMRVRCFGMIGPRTMVLFVPIESSMLWWYKRRCRHRILAKVPFP
jgi:hypothetical protein